MRPGEPRRPLAATDLDREPGSRIQSIDDPEGNPRDIQVKLSRVTQAIQTRVERVYNHIQSLRLCLVAFVSILLLLMSRQVVRYLFIYRFADIKLASFAILAGALFMCYTMSLE